MIVDYKIKNRKNHNFSKISLYLMFLRNMQTGALSIGDAGKGQSNLLKESNDINKSKRATRKCLFIKNVRNINC